MYIERYLKKLYSIIRVVLIIFNINNDMRKFSQLLLEVSKSNDSFELTPILLKNYIDKVGKKLPRNVQDAVHLTMSLGIYASEDIDRVMNGNKRDLEAIANTNNHNISYYLDLQKILKKMKTLINLMPQCMEQSEFNGLINGSLRPEDLLIDLSTERGRNAAAKMYTPLVYKIADQERKKEVGWMSFDDLLAAGYEGLALALNDYNPSKGSLKTYVGYSILHAIQNEREANGHTLSGTNSWAETYHGDTIDGVSIDSIVGHDDDEFDQDHLAFLGIEDDHRHIDREAGKRVEDYLEELYKIIDNKFSSRDCNIFYRYFGLKDFYGQKEKSKDIAKEYGMSEGNIRNSIINKILTYLYKKDAKSRALLSKIRDLYECQAFVNIMNECVDKSREGIKAAILSDDVFVLLEELTRFDTVDSFNRAIDYASKSLNESENEIINKCLSECQFIDDFVNEHREIAIRFLANIYPAENFSRMDNTIIVEHMINLSNLYNDYKS